jgi:hypothetical protein
MIYYTEAYVEQKLAAIERVRELHKSLPLSSVIGVICDNCGFDYPCPTMLALDGEL